MHKCRGAKRASAVSIELVSHIKYTLLNDCIYIYRACISGWCRMWDIGITFYCSVKKYTSGGQRQKKKREREKMFKEMNQSLGIFVSYSFKHMFNKIEMPIFAIRQLYVQFSMTICTIFPTVYTTHQSSLRYT